MLLTENGAAVIQLPREVVGSPREVEVFKEPGDVALSDVSMVGVGWA